MSNKILSLFCVITVCGLCLVVSAPAVHADLIAVNFTNTTGSGLANPPFTLGWQFTANENIKATALGLFDSSQDGLVESHAIGLWDNNRNLLVSTTIPSGTAATLDDKFRFVSVTPTNLTAGQDYFIGALFLSHSDGLLFPGMPTGFSTDPNITFFTSRFESGSSLAFPSISGSAGGTGYFGPNFAFTPIPEPATMLLLGSGLIGLIGYGRKKFFKK